MVHLVTLMPSKKPTIAIRLEESELEELQQWADAEFRTTAGLVTAIVRQALAERKQEASNPTPSYLLPPVQANTVHELVATNMSKLRRSGVKNLRMIANGEILPTKADYLRIISTLGLDEERQKRIWINTFDNGDHGEMKSTSL